jgi:hypothetical protein
VWRVLREGERNGEKSVEKWNPASGTVLLGDQQQQTGKDKHANCKPQRGPQSDWDFRD